MESHLSLFQTKLVHLTSHPNGPLSLEGADAYSTFKCSLPNPPDMHYNRKAIPISLSIPNVFDNIDAYNNTLLVAFNNLGQTTVTITAGHYTVAQLTATLAAAFNAYLQTKGLNQNVAVAQNSNTSKIEITSPDYTFQVQSSTPLANLLGITSTLQGGGNATAVPAQITPNVNTKPIILVHSTMSENNSLHFNGKESHLLAVADFSQTQRGAVKTFAATDLHQWEVDYTSHQDLRTWTFQLTDAALNPVFLPVNCRIDVVLKMISTNHQ